jgi:hypothetical protein
MAKPIVGGAFIRAVRLAGEMAKRGWHPVIANWGPLLEDPKVEEARGPVEFVLLDRDQPGLTQRGMQRQFAGFNPAIVVMGEGPFPAMELFYKAARNLDCPFVVLDQFYNHELMPWRKGVDLALLYGLASVWGDELRLEPPYEIVSPFIETVTPQCELPVPERLHGRQWITLVAYDDYVCQRGFDLLARLDDKDAAIVAISRDPETCSRTACFHDPPPERCQCFWIFCRQRSDTRLQWVSADHGGARYGESGDRVGERRGRWNDWVQYRPAFRALRFV